MNITLIQPFTDNFEPPKSLGWIAAALRKAGHNPRLIDLQQCQVRQRWKEIFASEPVEIVGLSAMTAQIKDAHEIAQTIKTELSPGATVVVGGAHATFLPKQTLEEFPYFDYVVAGEGELTIVELVSKLEQKEAVDESVLGVAYRSDGEVVVTPPRPRIRDLDSLPNHHVEYDFDFYLDYNSYGFTEKSASLIISRGCPFSCRFCATQNMWTSKYVIMSTDAVIKEIRYVMSRGAEDIKFRDSTFNINKKWVREFCEKVLAQNLKFNWAINARADLVDYDLFSLMRKAGLRSVYFGIESGSQRILDFYGKGITLKQAEDAFEVCRRLRIHSCAYWMLGALPETREDMEKIYRFAKKIKPDQSQVFIFMPLPGAPLYDYYIEQGYTFDYNHIKSDKAVFSSAGYSLDELEEMRKRWYDEFNRPPSIVVRGFNSIRDIRNFHDFKHVCRKVANRLHLL
jgi:anaerobic magnesium-protoporphyrin IX monomethyl ester cyclase